MPEHRYYQRGRRLISFQEAANRAAILLGESIPFSPKQTKWRRLIAFIKGLFFRRKPPIDSPLPLNPNRHSWAGLYIGLVDSVGHFLILGGIGGGKSLLIEMLQKSVLRRFRKGGDQRAFIYDVKREKYSSLINQNLDVPVHLLDPFDARGVAWDIAADVTSPADARQVAAALIQGEGKENDRFWLNAARNTFWGVLFVLSQLYPKRWTLRDAILIMRYPQRISYFLNRLPETAHLWPDQCRDEKTVANLMESFHTFLQKYEIVCALFQHCTKKISLKEWIKSDSVLLVAGHPRFNDSLKPIHQLIFDLLIDHLLSNPDSRTRESWFLLDEVPELPYLQNLMKAINLGRSKGVKILLAMQGVETFDATYAKQSKAILGQCRNKTFLRTDSSETANYMEQHLGQVQWLVEKTTHSSNTGAQGSSTGSSIDHSICRESLMMASEFMGIKPPSETEPVILYNDVPSIGCYGASMPLRDIIAQVCPPNPQIPNTVEVPEKNQFISEWNAADAKRLRLPPELLRLPSTQPDLLLAQLKTIQEE